MVLYSGKTIAGLPAKAFCDGELAHHKVCNESPVHVRIFSPAFQALCSSPLSASCCSYGSSYYAHQPSPYEVNTCRLLLSCFNSSCRLSQRICQPSQSADKKTNLIIKKTDTIPATGGNRLSDARSSLIQ